MGPNRGEISRRDILKFGQQLFAQRSRVLRIEDDGLFALGATTGIRFVVLVHFSFLLSQPLDESRKIGFVLKVPYSILSGGLRTARSRSTAARRSYRRHEMEQAAVDGM